MQGGLTYEKLFDFLREERNNVQLQKLPLSFYQDIIAYLHVKEQLVASEAENGSVTAEASADQLKNAKKIIENIYERREKKMLLLALHKSRTKSQLIDTSSLLSEEKVFFKQITVLLNHFREEIVLKLLKKESPVITDAKDTLDVAIPEESSLPEPVESASPVIEASDSPEIGANDVIPIKVTAYVDKFVGPDLDIIGPFQEGSVEKVPKDIAQLLIEKGSAEEIAVEVDE